MAYGAYGIGLSKEWALKMKINPVLYLESNSTVTNTIAQLLKDRRRKDKNNLTEAQRREILYIKCFTKNYSGRLERNGEIFENYNFYSEREWRLVPTLDQLENAKFSVGYSNYVKNKQKYNSKLSNIRFDFEHKDISYVIVEFTKDIPKVITALRHRFFTTTSPSEMDILISRICSVEQIKADY